MAYSNSFIADFRKKLQSLSDYELNVLLAKALGWADEDTRPTKLRGVLVGLEVQDHTRHGSYRAFDYKDWDTIGPIAERYDLFPCRYTSNAPEARWSADSQSPEGENPQRAIAFAMIERVALSE